MSRLCPSVCLNKDSRGRVVIPLPLPPPPPRFYTSLNVTNTGSLTTSNDNHINQGTSR